VIYLREDHSMRNAGRTQTRLSAQLFELQAMQPIEAVLGLRQLV
jgi:hypothetical protein